MALDYLERLVTAQGRTRGCPGPSRSFEQVLERIGQEVLRPPHGPLGYLQGRSGLVSASRSQGMGGPFPGSLGMHGRQADNFLDVLSPLRSLDFLENVEVLGFSPLCEKGDGVGEMQ